MAYIVKHPICGQCLGDYQYLACGSILDLVPDYLGNGGDHLIPPGRSFI